MRSAILSGGAGFTFSYISASTVQPFCFVVCQIHGGDFMNKFIPFRKLSKKKQRELNAMRRKTWGELSPVTRKPANSKAYDRRKARRWNPEDTTLAPDLYKRRSHLFVTTGSPVFSPCSHACLCVEDEPHGRISRTAHPVFAEYTIPHMWLGRHRTKLDILGVF